MCLDCIGFRFSLLNKIEIIIMYAHHRGGAVCSINNIFGSTFALRTITQNEEAPIAYIGAMGGIFSITLTVV